MGARTLANIFAAVGGATQGLSSGLKAADAKKRLAELDEQRRKESEQRMKMLDQAAKERAEDRKLQREADEAQFKLYERQIRQAVGAPEFDSQPDPEADAMRALIGAGGGVAAPPQTGAPLGALGFGPTTVEEPPRTDVAQFLGVSPQALGRAAQDFVSKDLALGRLQQGADRLALQGTAEERKGRKAKFQTEKFAITQAYKEYRDEIKDALGDRDSAEDVIAYVTADIDNIEKRQNAILKRYNVGDPDLLPEEGLGQYMFEESKKAPKYKVLREEYNRRDMAMKKVADIKKRGAKAEQAIEQKVDEENISRAVAYWSEQIALRPKALDEIADEIEEQFGLEWEQYNTRIPGFIPTGR